MLNNTYKWIGDHYVKEIKALYSIITLIQKASYSVFLGQILLCKSEQGKSLFSPWYSVLLPTSWNIFCPQLKSSWWIQQFESKSAWVYDAGISAQMCRPTRLKFSILSSIFSHILVLSFLKHIIESILKNTATELRTNFSTFSPRVIFCAHYFLINNPQQQRISELTTEVDLLQDSSSESIWTSSSKRSKCKETQPVLKWFFFFLTPWVPFIFCDTD